MALVKEHKSDVMQQQVRLVPMWALSLAVNLVVQVLSVAVHNHYKRIYNESSNKW